MRLGMDFSLDETPLFVKVAHVLQTHYGIEVFGITLDSRWRRLLKDETFQTRNLGHYLQKQWNRFDISIQGLAALEREYGTPGLSDIIFADKYFTWAVNRRSYEYEYILKMLVGHLQFWKRFLEEQKIDAFVGPGIQGLFDLTRLRVSQSMELPNLYLYSTRLPTGRFVVCRNDVDRWEKVVARYEWLLTHDLLPDEREQAVGFLAVFRAEHSQPGYMKLAWKVPGVKKQFVDEFVQRMGRYYLEGWGRGTDYITPHPLWSMYSKGLRIMLKSRWQRMFNPFELPRDGEPFVFFPLHYQPEASTLIWSPYFVDQLAVIENIAKSIPVTHKLYVKEHFSSIGRRPSGYYKRIKSLPNVRLIAPDVDSHALIQRSGLNIVITSTVGWESILYERPVIVLGNVFYKYSGLAYQVTDMTELPDVIRRAMNSELVDREKLLKFIAAIYWGSYPGKFNVPHADPSVMESDNVAQLAKGIYRDLADH